MKTQLIEPAGTLPALLASAAAAGGTVICDGSETPYAELEAESARVATGLQRLGVGPGDRVAIWLPNSVAWLACFFACARLGAIAVSVNTRFRSSELADVLGRSGAKVLVFWPGFKEIDFAGILADCTPLSLSRLTAFVSCATDDTANTRPGGLLFDRPVVAWRALASEAPFKDGLANGDAGCAIFTTSGTSSRPKFVLHNQRTLVTHAHNVARAWRLDPGSVTLLVPPLCGIFGLCTVLSSMAGRGRLVMSAVWNAQADADAIVRHGVTHMNASDTAVAQLLKRPQAPAFARTLRHLGYASFSPGEADIVARAERVGLRMVGLYGSSELQALLAAQDPDAPVAQRSQGGGRFVSGTTFVRTRDPETGLVLPHGETGELEFWAPESVMQGYFGNADDTSAAFSPDGWFRSGDLGFTHSRDHFVYLARMGDVLRLGGYLVNPAEIEAAIQERDAVAECQVIGVTVRGELKPVAFVIVRNGMPLDEADLVRHATRRLARHKVPIRVLAVDAFPVTTSANGTKIQKARLREMALAALTAGEATCLRGNESTPADG
jgi:fatty-acyl-CoA synthase